MTATPPRADLRTLAAEAARRVFLSRADAQIEAGPSDHARAIADAVLAAVLPEHRRMVLGEAREVLDNEGLSDARGLEYAANLIRHLAATPPPGPSAPVPAENAPAVPEDTPGGFYEPDEPTDEIGAAFTAGPHGRTAPPRGQTCQLDLGQAGWQEVEMLRADRDRLAAQVAHCQRVIARVRALHTALDGRCVECVEYCDCLDRVTELGDDVEVAATMRMCEHGNKPWPCPTIAAVDALPDAGTDQTEDEHAG